MLEPRNLRFGLGTDGVNPFAEKRSSWSTWPVLLYNYNIPSWLTTKKYFIILSMIIPGTRSMTGDVIDTYLEPLMEELRLLWAIGVEVRDASIYRGSTVFNLKAVLLWTMQDFPAYGAVSGQSVCGYKACPVCGPYTTSRRSVPLKKTVYGCCHRRWLPLDLPLRHDADNFGGVIELEAQPPLLSGDEILALGREREEFMEQGGRPLRDDPRHNHGVKRVPCFFSLRYWKV